MGDLLGYLPAAAAMAVGWYELRLARRRRFAPGTRQLCLFGVCMGAAMAVLAPATVTAAGRVLPAAAEAWPHCVGRELEMAALAWLALAAMALDLPDARHIPARWHVRVTVTVCAVAAVCFLASGAVVEEGEVVAPGAQGRVGLVAFDVLFTLYSLWSLTLFALPVHAQIRRSGPGPFRTGLRLVTASACVGGLWALWGLAGVANMARTGRQGAGTDPVAMVLAASCLVLACLGATAAWWRGALTAPARWLRAYRRYRALEPLWSALHAAAPGIALRARTRRLSWLPPRSAEFALYRRVIEIRDGYLALRPYAAPAGPAAEAGTADGGNSGEDAGVVGETEVEQARAAEAEAAAVAAAIVAARSGVRHGGPAPAGAATNSATTSAANSAASPTSGPAVRPVRGTVEAEAAWLVRVADAFARSAAERPVRAGVPAELRLSRGRERAPASAPGRKG
ncbi:MULTISPECIES: MAB_1171c family putative transporter [unclassified Streptomyces]|uniref:MAB_1171c family putative transporter n=1 Tax=unclassified Streptomyces TaxID=2593676 RepID=UPI00336A34AB